MEKTKKFYLNKPIRVFLFILITLLLFLGVHLNILIRDSLKESATVNLEHDIDFVSHELNAYLLRYTELLTQMSINKDLIEIITDVEDFEDIHVHPKYNRVLDILNEINLTSPQLNMVWIGFNEPDVLMLSNGQTRTDEHLELEDRPWYHELSEEKSTIYTSPYLGYFTQVEIVSIIVPIFDEDKLVGMFGVDISVDYIESLISSQTLKKGENVFIVTDKSSIIGGHDTRKHDDLRQDISEHVDQIFDEHIGVISSKTHEHYIVHATMPINNWKVAGVVDKENTTYQITLLNYMSAVIVIASSIIIGFYFFVIRVSGNYSVVLSMNDALEEKDKILTQRNVEIEATYNQLYASELKLHEQFDDIKSYTDELEHLKYQFEMAVEFTRSTVWEIDPDQQSIDLILGGREFKDSFEDFPKNPEIMIIYLFDNESIEKLKAAYFKCVRGESDIVYCTVKYKEENRWGLIHGKVTHNASGRKLHGVIVDISELKVQQAKIEHQAYADYLTHLPNRRKFQHLLNEAVEVKTPCSVLLMDLDNFKEINDTLGHVYGDEVLIAVSNKLLSLDLDNSVVSRFGGDEFLMLVYTDDVKVIESYIKKIEHAFKSPFVIKEDDVFVKFSIGVSRYPYDSTTTNELLSHADLAMYDVKRTGKHNYKFFSDTMLNAVKEKADIEKILRQAIKDETFTLRYQPQVDVTTGETVGFEALVRLEDNSYGPDEFIPVAEQSNLIIDIGRIVTKKVIDQLLLWQSNNKTLKPIAINFSVKQINDYAYISYLKSLLEEAHIDPEYIDIEITESVLVEDANRVIVYLESLKALGIKMSLDDFGTGYSSLNYLTFLPIDKLKLDKSLSDKLLNDKRYNVMENIISLSHNLDLKVVAEGIEDLDQINSLRDMGCNIIQGYYFSKPLLSEELDPDKKYNI